MFFVSLGVGRNFAINRKWPRLLWRRSRLDDLLGGVGGRGGVLGSWKRKGVLKTVDCVFKSWRMIAFSRIDDCAFSWRFSTPLRRGRRIYPTDIRFPCYSSLCLCVWGLWGCEFAGFGVHRLVFCVCFRVCLCVFACLSLFAFAWPVFLCSL